MQNNDNQTAQNSANNRGETNRKDLENEIRSTWLGMRDSNPRSWDQNPLPYHLANPHWCEYNRCMIPHFGVFFNSICW